MIDRDAILEFIDTRKRMLLAIASAILLCLAIVLGIMMAVDGSVKKKEAERAVRMKMDALHEDELFYPAEPLSVPGVQLSRSPKRQWNAEDAERWYTVPDESAMERLRAAGLVRIDALLESVP